MTQINSVNLVGRVGRDPEVKYFETGKVVAKFSLAVNRRSGDKKTDWFDLELWDKTAETAANYVKKGSLIGIDAELKFERWTDKTTGEPRSKPVLRVDRLELLGSKKENEEAAQGESEF